MVPFHRLHMLSSYVNLMITNDSVALNHYDLDLAIDLSVELSCKLLPASFRNDLNDICCLPSLTIETNDPVLWGNDIVIASADWPREAKDLLFGVKFYSPLVLLAYQVDWYLISHLCSYRVPHHLHVPSWRMHWKGLSLPFVCVVLKLVEHSPVLSKVWSALDDVPLNLSLDSKGSLPIELVAFHFHSRTLELAF